MMSDILKNKLTKTLLVSIFISAIVTMLMLAGFLNTWESKVSDAFYVPSNTLDDIVIVAIDDYSINELGILPWPRDHYARVIENLNQSSVIGIDIIFDVTTDTENDSKLADSLKTSNVVLASKYGDDFSFRNAILYGESLLKPNAVLGTPGEDFEIGFVNLYTEDGVTRSFSHHISGIEDHDHFSKVVVSEYTGIAPHLESTRMLINFYDEPGGYERI